MSELELFQRLAGLEEVRLAAQEQRRFATAPGLSLILVKRPTAFRAQLCERRLGFSPTQELCLRVGADASAAMDSAVRLADRLMGAPSIRELALVRGGDVLLLRNDEQLALHDGEPDFWSESRTGLVPRVFERCSLPSLLSAPTVED